MARFLGIIAISVFCILFSGVFNVVDAYFAKDSFVTIVNPVRISSYTADPAKSLMAEYGEVRKRGLPATWLLTYDAITNNSLTQVVSSMDDKQELGIFLEVTENFSKNSDVLYNKTDGWHRAASVFLTGYSQEDRRKLIDEVFGVFKKNFGYYPQSVGGWWVDSYSLSYMQQKYGITGVLGISDQYDLDGYRVWGTPWSIPFYPSVLHAGIPSNDVSQKIDVVTFRWAARDPLNGYKSPSKNQASLYSTQDYHVVGQSVQYLDRLIDLYAVRREYNDFAHLTIGSEADYSPETYAGIYSRHMDSVSKFQRNGVKAVTMREFAGWYRKTFSQLSPLQVVESRDLLNTANNSFWIQGPRYRIGLVYEQSLGKTRLVDLRIYQNNFIEPHYESVNKQLSLSINLPYVIDSVIEEDSAVDLDLGEFLSVSKNFGQVGLNFQKGTIIFDEEKIVFPVVTEALRFPNSDMLRVRRDGKKTSIIPVNRYVAEKSGVNVYSYYPNIPFTVKIRFGKYIPVAIIGLLIVVAFVIKKKPKTIMKQRRLMVSVVGIITLLYLLSRATTVYYVSQTEIDGLSVLRKLPQGKVLVYDKDCIRCKFSTKKPAGAAGVKSYVSRFSGQKTIIDYTFVTAGTSEKARVVLKSKSIDYIYLVKYEDYIESLPYLPQDLGLLKVYENANSEIWRVK